MLLAVLHETKAAIETAHDVWRAAEWVPHRAHISGEGSHACNRSSVVQFVASHFYSVNPRFLHMQRAPGPQFLSGKQRENLFKIIIGL
jgi:hypothetical protein